MMDDDDDGGDDNDNNDDNNDSDDDHNKHQGGQQQQTCYLRNLRAANKNMFLFIRMSCPTVLSSTGDKSHYCMLMSPWENILVENHVLLFLSSVECVLL